MSTVASRSFRSTPHRSAAQTWAAIIDVLLHGRNTQAHRDLLAVAGIVASLITDKAPKDAPIIVTCDGPRTRIYCLYDDDAIDGGDASEDALGFDPLQGNWHISLPCPKEDLGWVQKALSAHTERITARAPDAAGAADQQTKAEPEALVLDLKGFLGS